MTLYISEIFDSIQGEGVHSGVPMTFIRLQGCSFKCTWCDTVYAQAFDRDNGQEIQEILAQVEHKWVCITGGEPLSQPEGLGKLLSALYDVGIKTTVETSGLLPIPYWYLDYVESWVLDVKLPSSGEYEKAMQVLERVLYHLREQDQVKFVIQDTEDIDTMYSVLSLPYWNPFPTILLSPVSGYLNTSSSELCVHHAMLLEKAGFRARFSPQIHKALWGNRRGV